MANPKPTRREFPMLHLLPQLVRRCVLPLLVLVGITGSAAANYYELLRRVPDSANTLIMIDVERMLMSPIAMREKWRDTVNASRGEPLHVPINAERYMLASKLNFISNFENVWDVALIETTSEVSLPYLARMEGGYVDRVDDQEIAFSPRNAFFVSFTPTILGVAFPANRQDLGRWLRMVRRLNQPQISDYLRDAITLAHGEDQMVVAIDVGDLFTSRVIRDGLHRAESLAGKDVDLDAVTRVLSTIKGVTFSVRATDRLDSKLRVDFGESPAPLKHVAKALILEFLENQGMMFDEIKEWGTLVEAKAITLKGRLSNKGLRTLTNMIPVPAETLDLQKTDAKGATVSAGSANPEPAPDSKAAASKKYFQHISLLLEQLRTDLKGPVMSPKIARRMVEKAALEIDRLPVLNVDEELLAYGTGVSEILRNMRNLSQNASLEATYRQAGIVANSGYGYGGFYGGNSAALDTSVMHKQMTAMLKSNQLAAVTVLEEKSAEIRKKMTLKYQVEF
jgi:hypothetical protein